MRFHRRGGRKRIVAPDGSEIARTTKPQPDGTLVKALARAWRWQRMLDEGVYGSAIEISDAEGISKSYVSRILQLALLAPDVVERVLEGSSGIDLRLEALRASIPLAWDEQREQITAARVDALAILRTATPIEVSVAQLLVVAAKRALAQRLRLGAVARSGASSKPRRPS
jgi:uncharacterized protein YerC